MKKIIPILLIFLVVSLTDHAQPPPPSISGRTTINIGDTSMLTAYPPGGTWSSAATTIATVGTSGIVTGVSSGVVNIWYYPPLGFVYDWGYVTFTIKDPTYVPGVQGNSAAATNIYPSPATTSLTITSLNKIRSVTITNLLGQVLLSRQYNALQVQVSVADLPAGVYFVKINDTELRKFMKE